MKKLLVITIIAFLVVTGFSLQPARVEAATCVTETTSDTCFGKTPVTQDQVDSTESNCNASPSLGVCVSPDASLPGAVFDCTCVAKSSGNPGGGDSTESETNDGGEDSDGSSNGSSGGSANRDQCTDLINSCPDLNGDNIANDFEPDYSCVLSNTLVTPIGGRPPCCENKCKGDIDSIELPEVYRTFDVFNAKVSLNYDKLPALINLAFSTFLGIIALYALFRGVYLFAIKRPNAINEEDIAKISKDATALVTGFFIAVAFLFITQVVFSILGLPGINELDIRIDPESDVTGPRIIVG